MTAHTLEAPHSPPMHTADDKKYLDVPFEQKALAKLYGARWDANVKRWYYPRGSKLETIFSWRFGMRGTEGREMLKIPEAQRSLAVGLGVVWKSSSTQYFETKTYMVDAGTRLYQIYTWRPAKGATKPKAKKQKPVYTTPSLPHGGNFDVMNAELVPGHRLVILEKETSLARALGIRFPKDFHMTDIRGPEVLSGSWYERILSWHAYVIQDNLLPHALKVPVRDQGLAEYLGAEKTDDGWMSRPGTTIHTALNWRASYVPQTIRKDAA